jgi:hypothetical protein
MNGEASLITLSLDLPEQGLRLNIRGVGVLDLTNDTFAKDAGRPLTWKKLAAVQEFASTMAESESVE